MPVCQGDVAAHIPPLGDPASGRNFALEGENAARLPVEPGVAPGLPGTLLSQDDR